MKSFRVFWLLCLCLVLISTGKELMQVQKEGNMNQESIKNLQTIVYPKHEKDQLVLQEDVEGKLKQLHEENSDLIGWIMIPETRIDYPVMQSPTDPDFYLNHNFQKEHSKYGLPYIEERCKLPTGSTNIIIYGHHMKDGSMFADLEKYESETFYRENPTIQFETLWDTAEYEIAGILKMPANDLAIDLAQSIQFERKRDFDAFAEKAKWNSLYHVDGELQWGDSLLTLITCEYTQDDGRIVIIAKKL